MSNYTLRDAITEARKIRKYLVSKKKFKTHKDLMGDCGFASIMLAVALDDISILRCRPNHAWNIVEHTIIDITATQFNYLFTSKIRGVYIGIPLNVHLGLGRIKSGLKAYRAITRTWGFYEEEPKWKMLSTHWKS